jgi:membrane associated rhomboid family serine protease
MGLSDRNFGAPSMFRMSSAVKWLLMTNTGLFLAYFFAARMGGGALFAPFALTPYDVFPRLHVWQLATYLFLHSPAGFSHILWNMLALWMFGTPLEEAWGSRRFLKFYFFCGIGAGVCVVALNWMFGSPMVPTIGCSGAVYGLLMAFGMTYPRAIIYFFMLFPIEARWYVAIMGAIVFLSTFGDAGGSVSHFAHLGGMIFAFVWLKMGLGFSRRRGPSLAARCQDAYRDWRLRRARRKFQVYLKKQGAASRDWDDRVQ